AGRKMADGEGRHVPGLVFKQERDALVIHDVAVLDAVGAEPDSVLHRIRVGGMRHDFEAALAEDGKGGMSWEVQNVATNALHRLERALREKIDSEDTPDDEASELCNDLAEI